MRTTARGSGFTTPGTIRRAAMALLCLAALSGASSGCGTGSEALPSTLPPSGGGLFAISTSEMEDGVVNRSYSKSLATLGGTLPIASCMFSAGSPPPGLNIAAGANSCIVSGTPTMAGNFLFAVRAQDSASNIDTENYTVAIRNEYAITGAAPDPLPAGVEDRPYNLTFTVTTNTTVGLTDLGQVGEQGNGPLTSCVLSGLPPGMAANTSNLAGGSCQITISGAPDLGLTSNSMPQAFTLNLTVTDSPIPGSSTPARTLTQANIDLSIHGPLAFSLITADPASTTACTLPPGGGTFSDAASGGNAPAAVTGRTYGGATRCDLLFTARGGRPPYSWSTLSAAPAPIICAQGGGGNSLLRCNSGGNGVSGATVPNFAVQVTDTGNAATATLTQTADDQGHAGHGIAVNSEIAIDNQFLPNGVVGQPYSVTLRCDNMTGACGGTGSPGNAQALYTWTEVGGPANAQISVTGTNVAQPGNGLYSGTPTAVDTTVNPTIRVTDNGNDTTPSCAVANTCPTVTGAAAVFAQLLLVDADEDRVQRYDTGTGAPVFIDAPDLDNNSTPFRAAFSPNGTIVVIVDDGEGEASLLNNITGTVTSVDTSGGAGNPTGVAIGPKTSPLANPDSWVAYVANPTGGGTGNVDRIDIEPGGTLGTLATPVAIAGAKDLAITPTLAGPRTWLYVLSGTDDVCAIDVQPPAFTQVDLIPGGGIDCFSTAMEAGDTRFIEVLPDGSAAFVVKSDGMGGMAGQAVLLRLAITANDATLTQNGSTDLDMAGCALPNDLRSTPNGAEVWVTCGTDGMSGDEVKIVNAGTMAVDNTVDLEVGGDDPNPQDIAFNINGSVAFVTLRGPTSGMDNIDAVVPITTGMMPTAGTRVDTTAPTGTQDDITNPEGIDHIRDPQLNALIDNTFTVVVGQTVETSVTASGGVQPYTWKETGEALGAPGTACQGLSLDARTGRISGVATTAGLCTFSVEVRDASGESRTVTGSIRVKP